MNRDSTTTCTHAPPALPTATTDCYQSSSTDRAPFKTSSPPPSPIATSGPSENTNPPLAAKTQSSPFGRRTRSLYFEKMPPKKAGLGGGGGESLVPEAEVAVTAKGTARSATTTATTTRVTRSTRSAAPEAPPPPPASTGTSRKRKAASTTTTATTADVSNEDDSTTTTAANKAVKTDEDGKPGKGGKGKGKGKAKSGYAPPETYAHLNGVPDALAPGLVLLLVGLNPGVRTAMVGHCYSDPTNRFWRFLHHSNLTPDRVLPSTLDQTLPAQYSLGTTNIVHRPTLNQAELSDAELIAGVAGLEEKVRRWRPEAVCFVGKKIWESVYCAREGVARFPRQGKGGWRYGWMEGVRLGRVEGGEEEGGEGGGEWEGARVFVTPSTSGLVTMDQAEMRRIWTELGDWVVQRRKERGIRVPGDEGL